MASAALTPPTKKAAAELQLDDGQDQNTYQEDRSVKNATPSVAQTTDKREESVDWNVVVCGLIDAERVRKGISLARFSRESGIPATTASRMLHGRGRCTIPNLVRAARVIDTSLADIMRAATAEVNG